MSKLIWTIIIAMGWISTPTWAVNQDKISGLEVEAEVEEMEAFGESLNIHQAATEQKELEKESNSLTQKIRNLKQQNKRAILKTERLSDRYNKSYGSFKRIKKKADAAQKKKDRNQKIADNLQAKVEAVEAQAVESNRLKQQAQSDIKSLISRQQALRIRINNAQQLIAKNKRALKDLKNKQLRERKKAATLETKLSKLEKNASAQGISVASNDSLSNDDDDSFFSFFSSKKNNNSSAAQTKSSSRSSGRR